eukprot:m.205161 g.205161  ORF g.205161 m.205161 type:complete len:464 (-) comp17092_c2_seq9:157-1548(-)
MAARYQRINLLPRYLLTIRSASTIDAPVKRKKQWQQWLRPGQQVDASQALKPVRSKVFARKPRVFSEKRFSEFNLSPSILADLKRYQLSQATTIQSLSIHRLLDNPEQDFVIAAETGTGKTLTYLLPLLTQLEAQRQALGPLSPRQARAIVVAPTRELGRQIFQHAVALNSTARLRIQASLNDHNSNEAILQSKGCDLLVGVPGRLGELVRGKNLDLLATRHIVLDELDVLLDEFQDDLIPVLARCRSEFQGDSGIRRVSQEPSRIIGAAATISKTAFETLSTCLPKAKVISTEALHTAPANVEHHFVKVRGPNAKPAELLTALQRPYHRAIIFVNDAVTLAWAVMYLKEQGIQCAGLGGSMARNTRAAELLRFHSRQVNVLVCTDIGSRGLDLDEVDLVVNYDFPQTSSDYLHRCGRTGRVGRRGEVVNLIARRERHAAQLIEGAVLKRRRLNDLYDFAKAQ